MLLLPLLLPLLLSLLLPLLLPLLLRHASPEFDPRNGKKVLANKRRQQNVQR